MNVSGLALEENPIIINLKIDSVTKTFLIPNDVLQVLSIENRKVDMICIIISEFVNLIIFYYTKSIRYCQSTTPI